MIEVGRIRAHAFDDSRAVFLEVELRQHVQADGSPVTARVRWCPHYNGVGYGDWWVPDLDLDVLCAFPGITGDGRIGDDLDEGYAFAVVSTRQEPPDHGIAGDLAVSRRVFLGKPGQAYDEHVQGTLDRQVDDDEAAENLGTTTRIYRQDRIQQIDEHDSLDVLGDRSQHVQGAETTETEGLFVGLYRSLARWVGDLELRLVAPLVRLGGEAAVRKLVDERFLALYNSHRHSGGPVPDQQAAVDTHTTTKVRAE